MTQIRGRKVFRLIQLQLVSFFSIDFLSFFRGGNVQMFTRLLLQLVIATFIGIFLRFSFNNKENRIILAGILLWLIFPLIVSSGNWIFWIGCFVSATLGVIIGLYFRYPKTIFFTILLCIGIFTSFFISNYIFPKLTLRNNIISFDNKLLPNFIESNKSSEFKLFDKAGKIYTLDSFQNKIILFDFWFLGCKPCTIKDNALNAIAIHYKEDSLFKIVKIMPGSINLFEDFEKYDITPNEIISLYDSAGLFAKKLQVMEYPSEYMINKKGFLIRQFGGFATELGNEYLKNTISCIDSLIVKQKQ